MHNIDIFYVLFQLVVVGFFCLLLRQRTHCSIILSSVGWTQLTTFCRRSRRVPMWKYINRITSRSILDEWKLLSRAKSPSIVNKQLNVDFSQRSRFEFLFEFTNLQCSWSNQLCWTWFAVQILWSWVAIPHEQQEKFWSDSISHVRPQIHFINIDILFTIWFLFREVATRLH